MVVIVALCLGVITMKIRPVKRVRKNNPCWICFPRCMFKWKLEVVFSGDASVSFLIEAMDKTIIKTINNNEPQAFNKIKRIKKQT